MNSARFDFLMEEAGLDWIVVEGYGSATSLFYLTRGAHIGYGIFLKERGKSPILVHIDMERDNVKHLSDYNLVSYSSLNLRELNQINDPVQRGVEYYKRVLGIFNVKGRVYLQGEKFDNTTLEIFNKLRSEIDQIQFPVIKENIIYKARREKTEEEIEKIKSVADRTQKAFMSLIEYLKGCKRINGELTDNGKPITIGYVKVYLRSKLIENGLLDSSGMIIAQGRDGGVPHNHGNDEETVKVGVPIVFDIYPREYGGGFFFDMTRTYSFGEPSKEVIEAYEQVRYIQEEAVNNSILGKSCKEIEELVVNYFESKGHQTLRIDPKAQEGYVHSLGHGVGLDVHELPVINLNSEHKLEKGDVFTIEPGLYYPSKGFGIRIEDTLYIDKDGKTVNLTYVPKDLVL